MIVVVAAGRYLPASIPRAALRLVRAKVNAAGVKIENKRYLVDARVQISGGGLIKWKNAGRRAGRRRDRLGSRGWFCRNNGTVIPQATETHQLRAWPVLSRRRLSPLA